MAGTLGALLEEGARTPLIGREAELAALRALLRADGPRVVHLSGVTGIGKSTLLAAFTADARAGGATVIPIDCRAVEPSEPGLLAALADATGAGEASVEGIARRIGSLPDCVALVFDGYELFWLVDTFIRREFCPRLPDTARIVLSGQNGPVGAWLNTPGWEQLFRAIELGPLTERDAMAYLRELGIDRETARRINAVAHGHPLALTVGARLGRTRGAGRPEDAAMGAVVDVVARAYLEGATDPLTREALEAGSVLRRITEPLLGVMLPEVAPRDAMDRLRAWPFVEMAADGLFVHDAVRDAVSTGLMAADPERHRGYRIAAWRYLRREVARAPRASLWRYTADILYLLQNYLVREGFFPSGYQPLAVEPAGPGDESAAHEIAARHEGPESLSAVDAWWAARPQAFRVCRAPDGTTTGIFIVARGVDLDEDIITADPVAAAWAEAMGDGGHAAQALLLRRLLDVDEGEANSGSRGAFGLDVKRTYMELRPGLRYIYLCGADLRNFDWCDPLGFEELPALARTMDGRTYRTLRLDMGPGSVDGWLSRVVADELGVSEDGRAPEPFDPEALELVVGGARIGLTPLELGVMRALHARAGRPVSRADLVAEVWGYDSGATSNVVEAVVLTLRRKLGEQAKCIETVRGVGYRYRPAGGGRWG